MPHREASSVVTSYETEIHIANIYHKVIWPCNANRNQHAGKTYASQHTRLFVREEI